MRHGWLVWLFYACIVALTFNFAVQYPVPPGPLIAFAVVVGGVLLVSTMVVLGEGSVDDGLRFPAAATGLLTFMTIGFLVSAHVSWLRPGADGIFAWFLAYVIVVIIGGFTGYTYARSRPELLWFNSRVMLAKWATVFCPLILGMMFIAIGLTNLIGVLVLLPAATTGLVLGIIARIDDAFVHASEPWGIP